MSLRTDSRFRVQIGLREVDILPLKRVGIEIATQVRRSLVSQAVQTAADAFQKAVPNEFAAAFPSVILSGPAEIFDGVGCEIPVFGDEFENLVVAWNHPLPALSHTGAVGQVGHESIGIGWLTRHYSLN